MTDQEKGSKLGWKLGLSWNIFLSIGGVRGAAAYVGGIGMLPGGHRAAPRSRKTVPRSQIETGSGSRKTHEHSGCMFFLAMIAIQAHLQIAGVFN
ncbi:hypothetical protein [Burkholderia stagnalis]|uniref:hypothetical protein n=1 Tax=Burkholderia stagnalis TaxID=1503054 RepID=UPI000A5733AB|nr:hypothetical protein [Burkholderia stagnalis]